MLRRENIRAVGRGSVIRMGAIVAGERRRRIGKAGIFGCSRLYSPSIVCKTRRSVQMPRWWLPPKPWCDGLRGAILTPIALTSDHIEWVLRLPCCAGVRTSDGRRSFVTSRPRPVADEASHGLHALRRYAQVSSYGRVIACERVCAGGVKAPAPLVVFS